MYVPNQSAALCLCPPCPYSQAAARAQSALPKQHEQPGSCLFPLHWVGIGVSAHPCFLHSFVCSESVGIPQRMKTTQVFLSLRCPTFPHTSLQQGKGLSPGRWQMGVFLCSGGLSALLGTIVSLAGTNCLLCFRHRRWMGSGEGKLTVGEGKKFWTGGIF